MLNRMYKIILFISCIILFVGCTSNEKNELESEEKFKIVTTFYPIYISTLNVVKDIPNVEVVNMTKSQTGCLHDYQLTPEDLKIIDSADVIIINGAGMESFIEKILESNKDINVINASEGIELIYSDESMHNHEVGEEHGHEHGLENGHVWVSITNVMKQVENIKDGLSIIDNKNRANYLENSECYNEKLEELSLEMHTELDELPNREIVTFHESFAYFAKEFKLEVVEVINMEDGKEPSAKEKEEIINEIKKHGVKAIFTEPQYASNSAKSIANETQAKVYELNPVVTGNSTPEAINDYIIIMKENLSVLKEALK